jgi:glycosyltransferase involved in cell wall biosynthesis
MKIALLNGDVPDFNNGYAKFTTEFIKNLSERLTVHLINYKGTTLDASAIPGKLASNQTMIHGKEVHLKKRVRQLQSFLSKDSMVPWQFKELNIKELNDRLKEINPDVIIANQLRAAWVVPHISIDHRASIIYISHTCESNSYRSVADLQSNQVVKSITKLEATKLLELEKRVLNRVDYCVSFTPEDANRMKEIHSGPKHLVIPLGIDVPEFAIEPSRELKLLLVGSYTWSPKKKDALWLANEVLPLVNQGSRKVKLSLVGEGANELIEAIQNKEFVEIYSDVPSTRPYYQGNNLFVIPDHHQSGLKSKTLEAASYGLPIVSTLAGIEGSNLMDEKSCLLANTKEEFAKQIQRLLADSTLRRTLGKNARKRAVDHFQWENISQKYMQLIFEAVKVPVF